MPFTRPAADDDRARSGPAHPEEFSHLLAKLDCALHAIHGDQLVLGVALNEDVQAQRSFDES